MKNITPLEEIIGIIETEFQEIKKITEGLGRYYNTDFKPDGFGDTSISKEHFTKFIKTFKSELLKEKVEQKNSFKINEIIKLTNNDFTTLEQSILYILYKELCLIRGIQEGLNDIINKLNIDEEFPSIYAVYERFGDFEPTTEISLIATIYTTARVQIDDTARFLTKNFK